MTRIYNFATVEAFRPNAGPGMAFGVIAMAVDGKQMLCRFRSKEALELIGEVVGFERTNALPELQALAQTEIAAKLALVEKGVESLRVFRALVSPRQSRVRFVARGTRFCDETATDEMMDELVDRFLPASTSDVLVVDTGSV